MDKKLPLTTAATAFAATLAAAPMAQAGDNPFALVEYQGRMQLAANKGEMSCGGASAGGEMKCGASMDSGKSGAEQKTSTDAAQPADAAKAAPSTSAGK